MKAVVYPKFGSVDVLEMQEVAQPTPKDHQVLVKMKAASVNPVDGWRFSMPSVVVRLLDGGIVKPKTTIIGADIAGQVEAVGSAVTQFQPGDAVFGVAAGSVGGFAEYACAGQKYLALKPPTVSYEMAAAVPVAGLTALQALRDHAKVQAGQQVLIQGASGGVGTFAVQLAKFFGAEVTAVCSTRNVEKVRALGADFVMDYTQTDFTKNGQRYDAILGVNGYHSIFAYRRALKPNGIYVAIGGEMSQILQGLLLGRFLSRRGNQKLGFMGLADVNAPDLTLLGELLEKNVLVPVIDRQYPLHEVKEALRYLGEGHAQGKIVIGVG